MLFFTTIFGQKSCALVEDEGIIYQARVCVSRKKVSIEYLGAVHEPNVKPLDTDFEKETIITVGINSSKTLARKLTLGLTKPKDVIAAFTFELEPLLPYPIEESVTVALPLKRGKTGTELLAFAALKKDVHKLCETFLERGVDPEYVIPKGVGLCTFARSCFPEYTSLIVVDVGHSETTCLLVHEGMLQAIRSIPLGLSELHLPDNHEEIEPQASLQAFLRELAKVLMNFQSTAESSQAPLLFTGPIAVHSEYMRLIALFLSKEVVSSQEALTTAYSFEELCAFGACIGAAIAGIECPQTNLRKEDLAYTQEWRRWYKACAVFGAAMLIGTAALFFFFEKDLENKHRLALQQYKSFIAVLEKEPQEVEKSMKVEQPLSVEDLSYDALEERIFFVENGFLNNKETIPLHADVPRVSDVIAWLTKVQEGKDVRLEMLSYTIISRPEKEKPKAKYRVKVDLEFASQSPHSARDFYNSLTASNLFVDPKEEVKWKQDRGKYFVSFVLKDKTKYLD